MGILEILALVFLIILVLICLSDADLTTMYYDKFGSKLPELRGKVVWITGASTGIGAAMALQAAEKGSKLILTARSEEKLLQVKEQCLKRGSPDALAFKMDMVDFEAHKSCLDRVMEHFGRLDVMIHNAGISQRARWEHIEMGVDRYMFDVNVFSVIHLSRLIMPIFLRQEAGGMFAVNSSVAAKAYAPFSGTYSATKAALHGYMESLRNERLGGNIRITMLCPGPTFSNLLSIAATEKTGQVFSGAMTVADRRMTAERCAHLSLVAITHNIYESWIAIFPVLPLIYAVQYMPGMSVTLKQILGPKIFQKLRDGKETVKSD